MLKYRTKYEDVFKKNVVYRSFRGNHLISTIVRYSETLTLGGSNFQTKNRLKMIIEH